MSSSLSTSNENSVDSMPRGGNSYYSSQLQQQQQQYHYHMNQPLNYNNSNGSNIISSNNNNHHHNHNQSYSLNSSNSNYSSGNYNNPLNNYQHQHILNSSHHSQQQQLHNLNNSHNASSHQHYQHPSIAAVFPSIYAETLMSTHSSNSEPGKMMTGSAASNSSLISGTGSVSASASGNMQGGVNLMGNHYSSVQKQIQQDWSNREYIEVIISNIKKLTDFLNSFELSCKSKLAMLDEKLTKLERQIDFVEAKVTKGDTLN